jgi:serine/threonine protein kinase
MIEKINNRKLYNSQLGGALLGEGGFGCVISPPLRCKTTFHKFPYSIDTNYISKIVEYDESDESVWDELTIGKKLIKIDPFQKYFSPILDGCFLHKQKSRDLLYSKSSTNNSSDLSNSSKKEDKCNVYMDTHYLNLISKNAGITIEDTFETKDLYLKNYITKNYIHIMHHYCKALKLLKENNVLHCDIKTNNVMINYNKSRDTAGLTVIDFGLSSNVNNKGIETNNDILIFCANGTQIYKPIETTILYEVLYLMKKNPKTYMHKIALKKILETFKDNKKYYTKVLDFNRFGIKNKRKNKSSNPSLYGETEDILKVYNNIMEKYNNRTLTKTFLNDKAIFKWDVFSLGILFAELFLIFNIKDDKAETLINNMVHPFYWERYDIDECLKDSLFTKLNKTPKKTHKKTHTKTHTKTHKKSI